MKPTLGIASIAISAALLGFFAYLANDVARAFGWKTLPEVMTHELRAIVLLDGSLLAGMCFLGWGVWTLLRSTQK
jgi:hypothetical protein